MSRERLQILGSDHAGDHNANATTGELRGSPAADFVCASHSAEGRRVARWLERSGRAGYAARNAQIRDLPWIREWRSRHARAPSVVDAWTERCPTSAEITHAGLAVDAGVGRRRVSLWVYFDPGMRLIHERMPNVSMIQDQDNPFIVGMRNE